MLRRYAEGRVGWSVVNSMVCYVAHQHASMRARLDEVVGVGWREEWIAADIAGLLKECIVTSE